MADREARYWQEVHARLLIRQDRAARKLQRQMALDMGAAVQEACGGRTEVDAGCIYAAQRAIDRVMDRYYGKRRGDQAALWWGLITEQNTYVLETVRKVAARLITRHLQRFDPELLAALKEMGRNNDQTN